MDKEARPTSIADRIAALKLNQVGQLPRSAPAPASNPPHSNAPALAKRPRPALPNRRTESSNSIATVSDSPTASTIGNQPAAAPVKAYGSRPVPSLPPRRPAEEGAIPSQPRRPSNTPSNDSRRPSGAFSPPPAQVARRTSRDSIASTVSSFSVASNKTATSSATATSNGTFAIRAPVYDPSTLPPLPPKRTPSETAPITGNKPGVRTASTKAASQMSALSQRQGIRGLVAEAPPRIESTSSQQDTHERIAGQSKKNEPARPRKSALLMGFSSGNDVQTLKPDDRPERQPLPAPSMGSMHHKTEDDRPPPTMPVRPPSAPIPGKNADQSGQDNPPPLPPDLAKLRLSKPKLPSPGVTESTPQTISCLQCRDFSGPFDHAARFPRESIPSQEVSWLANNLTSPFSNATDKAFAIFAWLHHNIAYNAEAFFNHNVKPSTPSSTIATGLAVCEGYAGLFCALCAVAGLEARVIGGHGKGFGYSPLGPGEPVPPFRAGHAWAVVRIDNGEWKLCDPCWGAGHLSGRSYNKSWTPDMFTMPNADFGDRHYPEDRKSFFRADGRCPSWDEYLLGADGQGEGVQIFGGFSWQEGISVLSLRPRPKRISIAAERARGGARFSFNKVCEHWDGQRHGKGKEYCFILCRDGREPVPFRYNGKVWWLDMPAEELGSPGQELKIGAVNSFGDGDGRGLTREEFLAGVGRVGMGFGFLCLWTLVP